MIRKSTGVYPENWPEIAQAVKDAAGWKCVRCGHPHDRESGHVLTVHHADMCPNHCQWWNLLPLCQKCHLYIQGKVIMERVWILPHSDWFRPFIAGYYAHQFGLNEERAWVEAHADDLIAIGQGRLPADALVRGES